MALIATLVSLLVCWDCGPSNYLWTHYTGSSDIHTNLKNHGNKGTYSMTFTTEKQSPVLPEQDISLSPVLPRDLPKLQSFMLLYDHFTCSFNRVTNVVSRQQKTESKENVKQRMLIVLLLLLSGNVQPNPGPEPQCAKTPSDFKSLSGLKHIHLNVCSLLNKMDEVRIWVTSTGADIVIISETWLTKSVTNEDINIDGFNVYRMDRPKKEVE
uniref:Uncharacterized protein n=1 Tax=Nothobranchius furzeri TaxID=105023 RepID=A0A1A8AW44_NOTFU